VRHQRLAAPPGLRRHVDHAALDAGRHHLRQHRLHHEEHALDVDGEDAVERRGVGLQQRRHLEDRGVVEQAVDRAERRGRSGEQLRDAVGARHVGGDVAHAVAEIVQQRTQLGRRRRRQVGHRAARALAQVGARDGQADAAVGTGQEQVLARETTTL
jgi:hypothetical protein